MTAHKLQQQRRTRLLNGLLLVLGSACALVACTVCGASFIAIQLRGDFATANAVRTRVAGMPPTQTPEPPTAAPTATRAPTATSEPVILDLAQVLDGSKADITAFLGAPVLSEPITQDRDHPSLVGGTFDLYEFEIEGHVLALYINFTKDERALLINLSGLAPWAIHLEDWPVMARRLNLPLDFDQRNCQETHSVAPLAHNWASCQGYQLAFQATGASRPIDVFLANRRGD